MTDADDRAAQLINSPVGWHLLEYATEDREHVEVVWNARPGAPFLSIASARSGERMGLTGRCRRAPRYTPRVGERVFVEQTESTARVEAMERIDRLAARKDLPVALHKLFDNRSQAIATAARDIMEAGEPHLMTVTSGWIEGLQRSRDEAGEPLDEPPGDWRNVRSLSAIGTGPEHHAAHALMQLLLTALTADAPPPRKAYDRAGRPISHLELEQLRQDEAYVSIARAEVRVGEHTVHVSTIWTGLDDRAETAPDAPKPIIFETVVSWGDDNGQGVFSYESEAAALRGHARVVNGFNKAIAAGEFDDVVAQSAKAKSS